MSQHVKNKDLREALIQSKTKNELSKEALDMMIIMANKYSLIFKNISEDDKKDCVAVAIMDCYLYWRGYDPEKSQNAFAYITQIIKNGSNKFLRKIKNGISKNQKISLSNIYSI